MYSLNNSRAMKLWGEYSLPQGVSALRFLTTHVDEDDVDLIAGTLQGKAALLTPSQTTSVSVDKSTVWNVGQVPLSQDLVFCLGSGAVEVRQLSGSNKQMDIVKVCSQQLSAAPLTGSRRFSKAQALKGWATL